MEELNRALAEMGLAPEAAEGTDPGIDAAADANGPLDEAAAAKREEKKRRKAERLKQLQDAQVRHAVRVGRMHSRANMLWVGEVDLGPGGLIRGEDGALS